jgi:ATP-dependent Clp endopeptidase proteolytic subunit ClpP
MSKIIRESIDRFFDYGIHVETRTIYMGSEDYSENGSETGTDHKMAEKIIKAIHILSTTPDKPIKIIMNNLGGDWYHGMAMYDAIKSCPCHVTIEVMGYAMSMGSIILQAADERIIHPNANIMIHDGYDAFSGHSKNFELWAEQSKKLRRKMYEIYSERTGKGIKYWEKRCTLDFIMDAKEALSVGMVDSIAGEKNGTD